MYIYICMYVNVCMCAYIYIYSVMYSWMEWNGMAWKGREEKGRNGIVDRQLDGWIDMIHVKDSYI